ncbi:MAG: hypothetical protein GKR89_21120 [Candidatus Latescibacteria bacterium]|nr:hypothetical protein [Candidatus Latescibacterota bacterium]
MELSPDLLRHEDGTPATPATWPQRRGELYRAIVPNEYGGMPPQPANTTGLLRCQSGIRDWPGVQYHTYQVRATFAEAGEIDLTLSLWIPPGDGPFPVLLDGDGCWRYFNDDIVHQIVQRGNIAALFDRTETAADNKDIYRETGLYRLFPEASFGALAAWAWAYHRCVDALVELPQVRTDAIAVTGHSRGGKTALLAGATDERIALTNPNNSGIGGMGLHHRKATGSEEVDSFFGSGNIFWFGQDFADHRHRDGDLPYDQHFLQALVAPRLLLSTEAYEDQGANPPGTYAACQGTRPVFDLLGAPDRIGWAFREGGHHHHPADYAALLDFIDRHFHDRPVRRNFQRSLFPDLAALLA